MTLKSYNLAAAVPVTAQDLLAGLDNDALLSLRRKIDLKLHTDLTKIDLSEELGLQYRAGMVLLDSFADDKEAPINHRASALTSVSNILSKIIAQQKLVYSAERLKRFEGAFLKILAQLPVEHTRTFFDLYGEFLKEDVPRETLEAINATNP